MKIMVAGDFCPNDRINGLIAQGNYDFLNYVKEIAQAVDFSIVNLECPIIDKRATSSLLKYRPSLSSSKKALEVLQYAGIKHVTLANNHLRDYGDYGVLNTIKELDAINISHVGGGKNLIEASRVYYSELHGKKLAIVNICEHEFSIATDDVPGAAPINPVYNYYQIKEARREADFVLVIVHGGHELYEYPSVRMKELYRWFVDIGADAVINHHQHCVNGYEVYHDKPIFYGIGNLCFDNKEKRNSIWNKGVVVVLDFGLSINFELFPYIQCDFQPNVMGLGVEDKNGFLSYMERLSSFIKDDEKLEELHRVYRQKRYIEMSVPLTPYTNRFLISAYLRGVLPSFITPKRIMPLLNYFDCESHREVMHSYLASVLYKNR